MVAHTLDLYLRILILIEFIKGPHTATITTTTNQQFYAIKMKIVDLLVTPSLKMSTAILSLHCREQKKRNSRIPNE